MGRGLFYLIAAGVAAWSLYSHFADSREKRPPSRPRSPPPSRRCDDRQTDSSWVDDPPAETFTSLSHPRSQSPHIPSRRRDDWQTTDSSHPPVKSYASLGHPRSPSFHTSSRRCDDQQTDSSWVDDPPVETYASLSHPRSPSPHIPSRQLDDWQAKDFPVKAYTYIDHPQSLSPHTHCCRFDDWETIDSSRVEYPPVKTHASLSHPRSPSPHIPSPRRDDQQTTDPSEVEYPLLETSTSLRARAKQEGELRSQCLRKSKEAHKRPYHALKAYSNQAKRHACTMKSLNAQASAMIFKENNKDRAEGEIDLHGLYVKEAISYANMALKEARLRGDSEICLIVGKGKHSDQGIARLKPAIKFAMRKRGVRVDVDRENPGRLRLVI